MIASTKSARRSRLSNRPANQSGEARAMRDRYLPSEELASQAVAALPDVLQHSPDLADTLAMLAVDPQMVEALGGEAGAALILGLACDRLRQELAQGH